MEEMPVSSRRYLKKKPGNGAVGISFKRAASQILRKQSFTQSHPFGAGSQFLPQLVQRPQTLYRRTEQTGKATAIKASVFWGLPASGGLSWAEFYG